MIKWGIFISVFIAISLYAKYAKKNKKEDEFAMTDHYYIVQTANKLYVVPM